jgi:hypothetical protein
MRKTLTLNNPVVMQLQNCIFGTSFDYLESAHEHFRQILTTKQFEDKNEYDEDRVKEIVSDIHEEFIEFVFNYAKLKDQDLLKIGHFFDIDEPSNLEDGSPETEDYHRYYRKSLCAVVFAQITRKGKESTLYKLQDEFSDVLYFRIYDLELNNPSFKKRLKEVYPETLNHEVRNQKDLANALFRVMIGIMLE